MLDDKVWILLLLNILFNDFNNGIINMTVGYGLGMLLVGLIAIAIGGTIAFIIINKYVINKEDKWQYKQKK